ncbi:hypothetical protein SDRG_02797 [Saprolegnia diclina VS20]|uniref:Uncharacterized protein n=1 Tax=Saprolegnia diclina (strain VS20) TaxID=1156394 RepID=T0SBK7_SAPDV|nr:hypothetical protein SDRG_02797 [Saprolegnia diclina VS20]EQC40147.1 hypothetical protein SDRG_02797 [Saprolegnia diclina VS20]|eukprot:XP_008606621.1 hypothetical protein SDRG_02797 [Saprolegnia diclina VS20]
MLETAAAFLVMPDAPTARPLSGKMRSILGTRGCLLLASIEPVERHRAEGRVKALGRGVSDSQLEEAKLLIEEERRSSTTDKLLLFVLDAKAVFRNGGFGLSCGDAMLKRIAALADAPDKRTLDLSNIGLCDALVTSLLAYLVTPSCPVVALNIANAKLVPAQIVRLAKACSSRLESFQASHLVLPTSRLKAKRVDWRSTGCDHMDLAAIGALLEARCKASVQVLDLSENPLTGVKGVLFGGIESLSSALMALKKLQHLYMDDTRLRSDGLVLLASGLLATTSQVTLLSLSKNDVTHNVANHVCHDGVDALCEVLRGSHTLQTLVLAANDLDYDSAMKLSAILRVNDSITRIDLSGNNIGSSGLSHLARALHFNPPLRDLCLRQAGLNCNACACLADALLRNSTLTTLTLSENPSIKEVGWRRLVEALEQNAVLSSLVLEPPEHSRYASHVERLQALVNANRALRNVQQALATFDFSALSAFAQVNFVTKLRAFSEAELCTLLSNQSFQQLRMTSAQVSALQYFSSLEMYDPLRRLVWAYDAVTRRTARATDDTANDDRRVWRDVDLVTLPPLGVARHVS